MLHRLFSSVFGFKNTHNAKQAKQDLAIPAASLHCIPQHTGTSAPLPIESDAGSSTEHVRNPPLPCLSSNWVHIDEGEFSCCVNQSWNLSETRAQLIQNICRHCTGEGRPASFRQTPSQRFKRWHQFAWSRPITHFTAVLRLVRTCLYFLRGPSYLVQHHGSQQKKGPNMTAYYSRYHCWP